jgi:hypothetical protein
VITHPADNILGSVGIPDDAAERFLDFIQVRRAHLQKAHPGPSIVARRSNGVQDFVSQRGSQFSHRAHAVHVGEIRLHLVHSRQRS